MRIVSTDTVVAVDVKCLRVLCAKCQGDACAPVALGVAGMDEECGWWGIEYVSCAGSESDCAGGALKSHVRFVDSAVKPVCRGVGGTEVAWDDR